ncbi:MAG: DivIVA domain-containing protein, partial [Clostridia bacterium]|nr:DivIVA domain-containing protein [Clostridia bacterium]
ILNDAVENYKGMEETMRSAIISAQRTSEEIIKNAHEQADNIINDAKVRAQKILNDMDGQIQEMKRECAGIEAQSSLLRAKLRTVLNTYLGMLDELPEPKEETKRIEKVQPEEAETEE